MSKKTRPFSFYIVSWSCSLTDLVHVAKFKADVFVFATSRTFIIDILQTDRKTSGDA